MEENISEARAKLYAMCDKTDTSRRGMELLVDYYIKSLGWTEEQACEYALGLFKDGTITKIKMIGKDGKEI